MEELAGSNPINAMLIYAYAVLLNEMRIKAIIAGMIHCSVF